MILFTWASFGGGQGGGGGGTCTPHVWQLGGGGGGGAEYLMSSPPRFRMEINHVFQYLFPFYGHFYCTYPDHMFSLSNPYSDILSMYSVYMMRGNRYQ